MGVMIKKRLEVRNSQGFHARPASIFVKIANKYASDVTVKKGRKKVNGKSIMGLMMLAANQGARITLEIEGSDQDQAMEELEGFLSRTDETSPAEGPV